MTKRQRHPAPPAEPASADPAILPIEILPQPDDETCGPTCLHAVYRYWGDTLALSEVIASADSLKTAGVGRGTLAVMLGTHALTRGYRASLFTFNLHHFDPTWFGEDGHASPSHLISKLEAQSEAKCPGEPRFRVATDSYLGYLRLGGTISFVDLTTKLIAGLIRDGVPILAGLSATYLYRCAREFGPNDDYDDIRGEPSGHFVVLHGYDSRSRRVTVADPLADNPRFEEQRYTVPISRLVPAIMLGVLTYDSNLLVIRPREHQTRERTRR
ncbi:MAG: C39 family peptidase [Phycisphaerales bacterium]